MKIWYALLITVAMVTLGRARADAQIVPSPQGEVQRLIVIDDPETIPSDPAAGILYDGVLTGNSNRIFLFESLPFPAGGPAPPDRTVRLALQNLSDSPVSLVVDGTARGPSSQPTTVGQVTLGCYFVHRYRGDSATLTLAPHAVSGLMDVRLHGSGSTVNGIFDVFGGAGSVRVVALILDPTDHSTHSSLPPLSAVKPWRSGVFGLEAITAGLSVPDSINATDNGLQRIGTIGDDCYPVPSINDGRPKPTVTPSSQPGQCPIQLNSAGYYDLHGDYGVPLERLIGIKNSSNDVADMSLYIRPRGGDVWGTFVIDGTMMQIASVRTIYDANGVAQPYSMKRWSIPANSMLIVRIATMGQGESAYPADSAGRANAGMESKSAPHPSDEMRGAPQTLSCP